MNIALDYDLTYSKDPEFFHAIIGLARNFAGHDIRVVTIRDDRFDRTPPLVAVEATVPIIYTRGVAKKWYLTHFGDGFIPDIWVDDKSESVFNNSTATPKILAEWRGNRGEDKL